MADDKELEETKDEETTTEVEYEDDVIDTDDPVKMGDFVLSIFLATIPIVNIIILLVWIFGSNTKPSKRNWAKAKLVWVVINTFLGVIGIAALVVLVAAVL